ncbi:MAG: hypothetical protein JNL09_09930, partial [Anaerolineales bacterium]|nr:hypothetical protein [Anaerolineales bacterium]
MKLFSFRRTIVATLLGLGLLIVLALTRPTPVAQAGGTIGTGSFTSCLTNLDATLQNAIDTGGLITFNCGPNPVVLTITEKTVTSTITIDGGSLVNLSSNFNRHFNVDNGGRLRLFNIELRNGDEGAGSGGSIFVGQLGALETNNTRFINNRAGEGSGGAILAILGPITITNSFFQGNLTQAGDGGAIESSGPVTISNSQFIQNTSVSFGGAISGSGPMNITGSQFISNTASSGAGAIFANDVLNLTGSLVVSNSINGFSLSIGPGIVGSINSKLNIHQTTIEANVDLGLGFQPGGGLHVEGQALLRNSTVYNNSAWGGGGVYVA